MEYIKHIPFGIDDPYIKLPGVELSGDLYENEPLTVSFKVKMSGAGERAWIKWETEEKNGKELAQFQYVDDCWAFWTCELPKFKAGDKLRYRIFAGQGPNSALNSEWFEIVCKKWKKTDVNLIKMSRKNECQTLTDLDKEYDLRLTIDVEEGEKFFGLGEHYEAFYLEEGERYCVVYNQYKVQKRRGYAPVPILYSDKGFGIFIDTHFRTKFSLSEHKLIIEVQTLGVPLSEDNCKFGIWENTETAEIIKNFYSIVKPTLPPDWVWGPWLSANEWNNQKKIEKVIENSLKYDLPGKVVVIEAWSDEETFYIFNGAEYIPTKGEEHLALKDINFRDPWPDPVAMMNKLKEAGMKLVLWQIPVLRHDSKISEQHKNDIGYADSKNYVVKNEKDEPYRIQKGTWFDHSRVIDFFNPEASEWWKSKRKYLIEELGISGFKTDGGEHISGRYNHVYDGESVSSARNAYPEKYFKAAKEVAGEDGILFSRSGYTRTPANSLFWVGDEDSTWEALKSNITAGLNVSVSGNPFWGWDIAGFSGDLPSVDLYKNALEIALFTPIFQFHSERPGDPIPSAERSPWNIATVYSDDSVIKFYRNIVSLRMCLIPYIAEQAAKTVADGIPLTYPAAIKNPDIKETLAYYFGENFLVFPFEKHSSVPAGWLKFYESQEFETVIYIKKDAVIPISLPENDDIFSPHWNYDKNALLITCNEKEAEKLLNTVSLDKIEKTGFVSGEEVVSKSINWKKLSD